MIERSSPVQNRSIDMNTAYAKAGIFLYIHLLTFLFFMLILINNLSMLDFPSLSPECPCHFSDDNTWVWPAGTQSANFCLQNVTEKFFYFMGNSITRGEYFSLACELHSGERVKNQACLFSGSSGKLRERQMHLCPKNKFRSSGWKPRTLEKKNPHELKFKEIDNKLQNAFSCYFQHSGITLAYRWVDSLEEYLNGFKIARFFNPDAIFIQIALQTAEQLSRPAIRAKFFKEMEVIISSNGLIGKQIYVRSIDPVLSGENERFIYLNSQLRNWSTNLNATFVDSWSMLYSKRSSLYADDVHPDKLATKAKLDCILWMFCSKY